ncbi:MAG: hypothetical protein IAE80_29695, partial [Anaerolinea sp.]|nr:hypothetical protein [Anaerolinea sp.]
LVFAANSGLYELVVTSTDPQVQGTIQLLVTCVDQAPPCLAALGASGLRTNACPVCFAAGDCPGFDLSVTLDGMAGFFTWTPAEGADWYIFSIIDSTGGLLEDSPRLIEGATSNTYTFNPADMPRGPFTAIVTAGAEGGGMDPICVANVTVSFDGTSTETCSGIGVGADIVPGTRAAVAHWDAVPDAAAYLLHVYAIADDGGLIGIRVLTVPGSATTYHLTDVFPSEYSRFQIRVAAYRESSGGGAFGDMPQVYLCDGGIDITFDPLGPVHWGPAT